MRIRNNDFKTRVGQFLEYNFSFLFFTVAKVCRRQNDNLTR